MCTLSDLFACIRVPGSSDKDYTSPTHQRHLDDDFYDTDKGTIGYEILKRNKSLGRDQCTMRGKGNRDKQRSTTLPSSASGLGPGSSFPSTCIRPLARDLRISYEAMERYDEIFGGPDEEAGETSTNRKIPDQF